MITEPHWAVEILSDSYGCPCGYCVQLLRGSSVRSQLSLLSIYIVRRQANGGSSAWSGFSYGCAYRIMRIIYLISHPPKPPASPPLPQHECAPPDSSAGFCFALRLAANFMAECNRQQQKARQPLPHHTISSCRLWRSFWYYIWYHYRSFFTFRLILGYHHQRSLLDDSRAKESIAVTSLNRRICRPLSAPYAGHQLDAR